MAKKTGLVLTNADINFILETVYNLKLTKNQKLTQGQKDKLAYCFGALQEHGARIVNSQIDQLLPVVIEALQPLYAK